MPPLADNTV